MSKFSNAKSFRLENKNRWYVVANRGEAVIFKQGPGRRLSFIERIPNPDGAKTESELDSDRPGTVFSSTSGSGIRHATDRRYTRHEQAAIRFARRIAEHLRQAKASDRFEELILTAGPHFLGLLRKELSPQVRACVLEETPKELNPASNDQIREHLQLQQASAS